MLQSIAKSTARAQMLRQSTLAAAQTPQRGYFSIMDRVKDQINKPLRHIKSFVEPDGISYNA